MPYQITDDCVGCGACAKKCPESAINGQPKTKHQIDSLFCSECGVCFNTCPRGAILDPQGRLSPKKGKKVELTANINTRVCAACKTCLINCPQEAIEVVRKGLLKGYHCKVDPSKCLGCGACLKLCIMGAITLQSPDEQEES
jgi:electron transport complex protein RnfB